MILIWQQLRLAGRTLVRAPGFVVAATLTLALGIGLSTAVFTVTEALLLRNLPVENQAQLATLWAESKTSGWSNLPLPLDQVREFERQSRTVEQAAFFTFRGATPTPIRIDDRSFQLRVALVSGNYFDVLRARPLEGRLLMPDDDMKGAEPVLVLSYQAWQQRFGGDSGIVGRSVTMLGTDQRYRVVGVTPRGLTYPRGTEAWVPLIAHSAAGGFLERATGELNLVVRLRSDASVSDARSDLTAFLSRSETPSLYQGARGVAQSLAQSIMGDTRPALLVVALAAGLLLVITCVNVANLLVIRALGQARELVVRAALGATRAQLVTQQLIESALLCFLGGALGVVLARLAVVVFVGLAPASLPRLEEIRVGGIALLGAVLITALAMVLSSIGPTIFASHTNADEVLRSGARHTVGTRTRWVGDGLVAIQVALAAMSLSGAVVMTRSLVKLWRADLSFDAQRMVVAELAVQPNRFASQEAAFTALDLVRTGLKAIPGVTAVSPVVSVPFVGAGGGIDGALALPGQSSIEAARNPVLNLEVVAPNYFATLGIPIQGRSFDDNDRAAHPPVVILSRGAAHALWPNENPIGKRVAVPGGGEATVVGLVPETRYRELEQARPSAYFPFGNGPLGSIFPTTLLIRTSVPPATLVPALRRAEVLATHGLAMVSATPLETLLDGPRAEPRFRTFIILVFATSAVVLAAIGLFTVIGTRVRQRRQELAIRMVLGATSRDVGALVMARGLAVAVVGTAVGMIGALATSRLLSGLLFEVAPADGVTFALVAGVMLIVAAAASYVPARIGMKIRPATVLQ